jgi:hypothetical protein
MKEDGFSALATAAVLDECYNIRNDTYAACIEHCDKDANRIVHALARQAFHINDSCIWVDKASSYILNSLVNDVTILSLE